LSLIRIMSVLIWLQAKHGGAKAAKGAGRTLEVSAGMVPFKTSMEIQRLGPAAPPLNSSSGSSRLLLPGIDHYFRHLVLLVSPYLVHLRSLIE
jgi:hypothetical protein